MEVEQQVPTDWLLETAAGWVLQCASSSCTFFWPFLLVETAAVPAVAAVFA